MVIGLLLAAVFAVAPLFVVGPGGVHRPRALSGLSASIYDPAARGYLVDANPPERHGELFGLYGAAQMGGLMIGPAIGGIAAAITNQPTVVFWVAGLAILALGRPRRRPRAERRAAGRRPRSAEPAADADAATAEAVADPGTRPPAGPRAGRLAWSTAC